jgi:3-phosphoshikimate 1-carboxyvinyltransferase
MTVTFKPCTLHGRIDAPSSKSMAHRYLICAALSGQKCVLKGIDLSEDILATIDCLEALGANIKVENGTVTVDSSQFMKSEIVTLNCRESGSTLRFLIPLALCLGKNITFYGSDRLFERPLDIYEDICLEKGLVFNKSKNSLTLNGKLDSGYYRVRGDVSSQFITGLIFALVYLGKDSVIEIIKPFESRPYIDLTLSALKAFGADIRFGDEYRIEIKSSKLSAFSGAVEGDYSNAAFLDAFNRLGSDVKIFNLDLDSLQGDRVFYDYFDMISNGSPTLDISDCPDLGPVLFALAAMKNGAVFLGTERLRVKECDRVEAMKEELSKLGFPIIVEENRVTVEKCKLAYRGEVIDGHNDHRIVMAMSVILSKIGGTISGAQAVGKSYPSFFEDIASLGAEVELL